jgi:hypothetical protein
MNVTTVTRCVALDELCPDDVLAEPVLDANGGVLVAAGASIGVAMAERLGDRGVIQVVIVRPAAQPPLSPAERDAAVAAERQRVKARIDHLFRYGLRRNEIHPLMHLVWRHRSESL